MTAGNSIQIVQGAQYGSEAKGAVAAWLVENEGVDIAVRTGATNAGHTVYYKGKRYTMQQLPVGWIRPTTQLVIGAGALVDPSILQAEIDMVNDAIGNGTDVRNRLLIDARAYLHWPWAAKESAKSGRHAGIGATGKGCSEAIISRLRSRGVEDHRVGTHAAKLGITVADTEEYLNTAWDEGAKIQLEGTQGQLLDLCLGPYPYVTHKQTGPAQWLSECGLSPSLPTDIVSVVRTFPIRVAGNSGPLPLEMSWPELAGEINTYRHTHGLPYVVDPLAVEEFEDTVREVAGEFDLPPGSDQGLDQHCWANPDVRVQYKNALSSQYARAMAEVTPECRREVGKLFEMTTVTKKLRRIARLDYDVLRISSRQARPSRVAVTFLNYRFPHQWYNSAPLDGVERDYLASISETCRAPVFLTNRGPLPEHFIKVKEEQVGRASLPLGG